MACIAEETSSNECNVDRKETAWGVRSHVIIEMISHVNFSAVKAVSAGQLAVASSGIYSVNFDEALEAMRLTAQDMSSKYKETSLSVSVLRNNRIYNLITTNYPIYRGLL